MRIIHSSVVAAIILACAAPLARARTIGLDKDGLTIWVPDQWKVDQNESAISALAPNGGATAMFVLQPIRDLDLAYKSMPAVVRALLPTIQFGAAKRTTVANVNAIIVNGIADVQSDAGATKIEVNIVVLVTPGQRSLFLITMAQAESASQYDAAIRKILAGIAPGTAAPGGGTAPAAPKDNPCWELKSQPNGWSHKDWHGVSYLVPPGWTSSEGKNPNTDDTFLQIANAGDGSSILVFTYASARPDAAWQALAPQLQGYGLGDVAWGEVVGQRALCAKGGASDGVLFHRGQTALVMLGRAGGDPSTMRGILGSIRWK
jgi:hypothetical protein